MTRVEIVASGHDPAYEGLLWAVTEEDGSVSCGWYADDEAEALAVSG